MILNGLFFFVFWPTFKLGLINDPKSTQTEGSTNKRSCAAGVEARLLGLPLAMDKRVMSIDDREVQYCIMKRGMIIARQRRRSIVYIMWFLMIKGGIPVVARADSVRGRQLVVCRPSSAQSG